MRSAQPRITSGVAACRRIPAISCGQQLARVATGARCDRTGSRRSGSGRDRVTRSAMTSRISRTSVERLACRVGDVPVIDAGRDVGTDVAAAHRHRPVGVQLHLDREALGLVAGEVDSDLAHHLDDFGPHLARGLRAGGLGAAVGRAVAFEERLGHLRAPRVVGAHEQHVLHQGPSLAMRRRPASRRTRRAGLPPRLLGRPPPRRRGRARSRR